MTEGTKPAAVLLRESRAAQELLKRGEVISGLRAVADALADNEAMPRLQVRGSVFCHSAEQAQAVLALGDVTKWEVKPNESEGRYRFQAEVLVGGDAGLQLAVWADPAWVCDTTGVRTVTVPAWTFRGQPVAS